MLMQLESIKDMTPEELLEKFGIVHYNEDDLRKINSAINLISLVLFRYGKQFETKPVKL